MSRSPEDFFLAVALRSLSVIIMSLRVRGRDGDVFSFFFGVNQRAGFCLANLRVLWAELRSGTETKAPQNKEVGEAGDGIRFILHSG